APPKKEAVTVKVDLAGLKDRVLSLAIQPANYRNLQSVGNSLYYVRQGSRDTGPQLQMYDLNAQRETALGSVTGYEISADQKKMLVAQPGRYAIIDLPRAPIAL